MLCEPNFYTDRLPSFSAFSHLKNGSPCSYICISTLRSLSSAEITPRRQYYGPLRILSAQPVPYEIPVALCVSTNSASRVATSSILHTCQDQYPPADIAQYISCSLAELTAAFPMKRRVEFCITSFKACSIFTHVSACMLAESPTRSFYPKCFNSCRYLHHRFGCYQMERQLLGESQNPLGKSTFPRRTFQ